MADRLTEIERRLGNLEHARGDAGISEGVHCGAEE